MYKNKSIIAIIPARSGSKGVKNKNIRLLSGKPLIAYTIEVALKSKIFDKIIVSTDSNEISNVALSYGAEVPFIRPPELATDTANSMDVIIHAINFLRDKGENFDYVMKLQPTSPLRKKSDIINAIDLILDNDGDSVISVSECRKHPLWANTLNDSLKMENFIKDDIKDKNRQELPVYYELNGMIFLAKTEKLLITKDWYMKNSFALIVDSVRAIDIDDIVDFKLAEILINDGIVEL